MIALELILFSGMCREQCNGHLYVLESIEWGAKVKIVDVDSHELCIFCAENAVPQKFCCCHVRCSCSQFTWVLDQVTPCCDPYPVGICFLWSEVHHKACISNDSIAGICLISS